MFYLLTLPETDYILEISGANADMLPVELEHWTRGRFERVAEFQAHNNVTWRSVEAVHRASARSSGYEVWRIGFPAEAGAPEELTVRVSADIN